MKRIAPFSVFCVLLLSSCKHYDICIRGEASNLKAGAAIISKSGSFYLSDKLVWNDQEIGKVFFVKGSLKTINADTSIYVQGVINKNVIENYKIRRVWIYKIEKSKE